MPDKNKEPENKVIYSTEALLNNAILELHERFDSKDMEHILNAIDLAKKLSPIEEQTNLVAGGQSLDGDSVATLVSSSSNSIEQGKERHGSSRNIYKFLVYFLHNLPVKFTYAPQLIIDFIDDYFDENKDDPELGNAISMPDNLIIVRGLGTCKNKDCKWCKGTGVIVSFSPTTNQVSKYHCYDGSMIGTPFETYCDPNYKLNSDKNPQEGGASKDHSSNFSPDNNSEKTQKLEPKERVSNTDWKEKVKEAAKEFCKKEPINPEAITVKLSHRDYSLAGLLAFHAGVEFAEKEKVQPLEQQLREAKQEIEGWEKDWNENTKFQAGFFEEISSLKSENERLRNLLAEAEQK
jgi:hypothetical protein